jgi:hypothetical protein
VATICTYIAQFFSGEVEASTPHLVLILVTVTGGMAVGGGIIWEANRSGHLCTWPTALVFFGVIIEAAATVVLFEFDEGITRAQQSTIETQKSTIIALETKLRPRSSLLQEHEESFVAAIARFKETRFETGIDLGSSEQTLLAKALHFALVSKAGWQAVSWDGGFTIPLWVFGAGSGDPKPARWAPVLAANVEVHVFDEYRQQLGPALIALVAALKEAGITAADAGASGVVSKNKDVIHIWIGEKQ